jgi:hypothetical protein
MKRNTRAPWFFLWVQQLLKLSPFLWGVAVPYSVIGMALLPYPATGREREFGQWLPRETGLLNSYHGHYARPDLLTSRHLPRPKYEKHSRRDFLGFAIPFGTRRLLGRRPGPLFELSVRSTPGFDIGPAPNYRGIAAQLSPIPAIVIRERRVACRQSDMQSFGCAIEERNFGFECPCRSSRYDPDGRSNDKEQ